MTGWRGGGRRDRVEWKSGVGGGVWEVGEGGVSVKMGKALSNHVQS